MKLLHPQRFSPEATLRQHERKTDRRHIDLGSCNSFAALPCIHQLGRPAARQRSKSDIPPPAKWPHRPVLLCSSTLESSENSFNVPDYGEGPCPLGYPFRFESELFVGTALVRIRDVYNDNDGLRGREEDYFKGRNRRLQTVIQGRFKKDISVSEVRTGHEFTRPFRSLPPRWILTAGAALIGRVAPRMEVDFHSDKPHMFDNLAATSQVIRADIPGNEPLITDLNIAEEFTAVLMQRDDNTGAGCYSASQRKALLSDPKTASLYTYYTDRVYTFEFYQHLLDVSTYKMDLGFAKVDISQCLNGQPIQVLAKTVGDTYLWSFQIWHENLVQTK